MQTTLAMTEFEPCLEDTHAVERL